MIRSLCFLPSIMVALAAGPVVAEEFPPQLRLGRAGHAFEHLGGIGGQAEAAAASGATIIYPSGLGGYGYEGLPDEAALAEIRKSISEYNASAKQKGVELAIGYLCATSIVGLDDFDKNWSPELRRQFQTPPPEWRQVGRDGKPLASWYGGQYNPACMNHPDWRAYQRYMVRQQLETGHDGVFFDNPTVHMEGCYCVHCMEQFAAAIQKQGGVAEIPAPGTADRIEALRTYAAAHPKEFMRFRSTIARDFLAHIRDYARTVNPAALITCNNSLNTPAVFFGQCRTYAYNIHELSKAEDYVVVEDMVTQPRVEPDGKTFEYGPTYKQLHAISHGKPIVAVTIAETDYHTAPRLVRLAMAEAAAHNASYLSWPTWPEAERQRMIAAIRPQAELLRRNEALLNDAPFRADVILYMPFERWVESDDCRATELAAALTRANVQYVVVSEDNFNLSPDGARPQALLIESMSVLTPDQAKFVDDFQQQGGRVVVADDDSWLQRLQQAVERPSLELSGPATVRAVVHDQPGRTVVHLLNLNAERISSFEDRVTSATNIALSVNVPLTAVGSVTLQTADPEGASGPLPFVAKPDGESSRIETAIPRLDVNALLVIAPK